MLRHLKTCRLLLFLGFLLSLLASGAYADVTFFTDRAQFNTAAYNAANTFVNINFEGLSPQNGNQKYADGTDYGDLLLNDIQFVGVNLTNPIYYLLYARSFTGYNNEIVGYIHGPSGGYIYMGLPGKTTAIGWSNYLYGNQVFVWTNKNFYGPFDATYTDTSGNSQIAPFVGVITNDPTELLQFIYFGVAPVMDDVTLGRKLPDAPYAILDIGNLSEANSSIRPNAINNVGWVVGVSTNVNGNQRPFLWNDTFGFLDLGTLGGDNGSAVGITNRVLYDPDNMLYSVPTIVGNSDITGNAVSHAATFAPRYDDAGYPYPQFNTNVDLFSQYGLGPIVSIHDPASGNVYEWTYLGGNTQTQDGLRAYTARVSTSSGNLYIFDPSDIFLYGTLGGTISSANAVDGFGDMVGVSTLSNGDQHGFINNSFDTSLFDLGTLGGTTSAANGVSGDFSVYDSATQAYYLGNFSIAGSSALAGDSASHAVVWTGTSGLWQRFFDPPLPPDQYYPTFFYDLSYYGGTGALNSYASAANTSQQIIGVLYPLTDPPFNSNKQAVLWQNGAMQEMSSLIPPGSGWTLTEPTAINDWGQITGTGYNSDGNQHAFLLTPTASPSIAFRVPTLHQMFALVKWTTSLPTNCTLDYGPTPDYGSTINLTSPYFPFSPLIRMQYLFPISGLTPGTTYHYRVTATSGLGKTTVSPDQTFTTLTPARLTFTATFQRSNGKLYATITATNRGGTNANSLQITSAVLNTTPTTTSLPYYLGTVPAGGSESSLYDPPQFPGTAGASGSTALLKLRGTYRDADTDVDKSITSTIRVKLP